MLAFFDGQIYDRILDGHACVFPNDSYLIGKIFDVVICRRGEERDRRSHHAKGLFAALAAFPHHVILQLSSLLGSLHYQPLVRQLFDWRLCLPVV